MLRTPCQVGAVVLAAGQSKRMGVLKQTLPWDGKTIIEHVVDCVIDSGISEVVVVVGHRGEEVSERLAGRPVKIVTNPDYERGISSSLVRGIGALHAECRGIMVVLGDQPILEAGTLRSLVEAFRRRPAIIVPVYKGQQGHPVIFPVSYVSEMMALTGDKGARSIIDAHSDDVAPIEVETDSVVRDVDNPDDYDSLRTRHSLNRY
ncbi:MAG: molybdenum cofactor cytidylyltransferase [Chloroflexi bacterium]|nr:molybdenum cofactor cytidylyltransferase [Chloroflexota bacterium]